MVASSEQQRAPVIVNKPAIAHARSNQPGAPLSRDDSAEVIKIPEPIIEPITIMVASTGPSARTRPRARGGDGPPSRSTGAAFRRGCAPASWLLFFVTTNSAAHRFSRLRAQAVTAVHVRTQQLRVYRHVRRLFLRSRRHRGLRPSALCRRATPAAHAGQLLLGHEATHPVAYAEPATRHSGN